MTTITERLTKYQFLKKNLDRELFNVLKDNFDKKHRLMIEWYDGDINNVSTMVRYLNFKYASNLDGAIRDELEVIFDKIYASSILSLVQIKWITSIVKDQSGTTHYTTETLKLIDYRIPTDGWDFNKYLNRWVRKESIEM